ncbi:MAG: ABC transporter ATP-binding protein, partial [Anaerolineaceae bacterium]|nr:ABC transporter ATP-binding protein [Anaerolineaceae bacterium]
MGFYSSLAAEKYDRQYTDRALARRIINYFKPQVGKLIFIILTVFLISGTGAAQPWVVSKGVDLMASKPTVGAILGVAGVVFLIGFTGWLGNFARRKLTIRAISEVLLVLAADAFKAAVGHDLSFYDKFSSGRIQSRITTDTREFGNLVVLITDLVSQVVETIILSVILFRIDIRLTLYLFAMVPVIFLLAIGYRQIARKVTRQGMRAMADVNASIKETTSGIAVAKNFRQETGIYSIFNQANLTSYK